MCKWSSQIHAMEMPFCSIYVSGLNELNQQCTQNRRGEVCGDAVKQLQDKESLNRTIN